MQASDRERPEDSERHANNLELFLDLVFVFAVTQLASLASHDTSAAGVGRAFLIEIGRASCRERVCYAV